RGWRDFAAAPAARVPSDARTGPREYADPRPLPCVGVSAPRRRRSRCVRRQRGARRACRLAVAQHPRRAHATPRRVAAAVRAQLRFSGPPCPISGRDGTTNAFEGSIGTRGQEFAVARLVPELIDEPLLVLRGDEVVRRPRTVVSHYVTMAAARAHPERVSGRYPRSARMAAVRSPHARRRTRRVAPHVANLRATGLSRTRGRKLQ